MPGIINNTKSTGSNNIVKNSNLLPEHVPALTPEQRSVTDKMKQFQGTLTGVLRNKTKGLYNVDSIVTANANRPNFRRQDIGKYADEIVKNQGDYALTPEEVKAALGNNYQDYVKTYGDYIKTNPEYAGVVNTKGALETTPDVTKQNFGARQMIEVFPWKKEEKYPYVYLQNKEKKEVSQSFKKGGTIHIDPKNKGKFTETKKKTGKSTEELTHSKNPLTRKRAVFAQNAKKWNKKECGGLLKTPR